MGRWHSDPNQISPQNLPDDEDQPEQPPDEPWAWSSDHLTWVAGAIARTIERGLAKDQAAQHASDGAPEKTASDPAAQAQGPPSSETSANPADAAGDLGGFGWSGDFGGGDMNF